MSGGFQPLDGGMTRRHMVAGVAGNQAARYTASPTYCFTDAGGTTPAGNGDLIRVWKDRSGNALDLSQATSGNRPSLIDLGSGKWCARSDGNRFMVNATGIGGNANAVSLTVAAAVNPGNTTADKHLCDLSSSFLVFATNDNSGHYGWFDGAWRNSGTASATGTQVVIWKPNSGSGVGTIRKAGVDLTTSLTYSPGALALNTVVLGANHLGAGNSQGMDLYEFVVWKRDLTAGEVANTEAALALLF